MKLQIRWGPGQGGDAFADREIELVDVHPFVDSARVAGLLQQALFRLFGRAVEVRSLESDVYRAVFDTTRSPTVMNPPGPALCTIPGAQDSLAAVETKTPRP